MTIRNIVEFEASGMKDMKRRRRKFISGILNHVYQRTVDRFLIFYSVSDYLVYVTMLCTIAPKYKVRVVMVSPMPDHIHLSVIANKVTDFSGFMCELTSTFARDRNNVCHHDGEFFESPFGSAPKYGNKKARSNIIYVGNNGPERRLAAKAELYRWNFLAYAFNDHPFSEPIIVRKCSWKMKKTLREVKACKAGGKYLSYRQLQRMFSGLDRREKEQLTDFIISTYNILEYQFAIGLFDSYEDLLIALHSNTGSEHDINEVFVGKSDACYSKMISIVMKHLDLNDIHDMLKLSMDEKFKLFQLLSMKTDALPEQIAAFLHIPVKKTE